MGKEVGRGNRWTGWARACTSALIQAPRFGVWGSDWE